MKYKGRAAIAAAAIGCAALLGACDDDFGRPDRAGSYMKFDISVATDWTNGRPDADGGADARSRCTSITPMLTDGAEPLYLHCDESTDAPVAPASRGAMATTVADFSLSAICYVGSYPDDETANDLTTNFAHNIIYSNSGLPADGSTQLQWPGSGRIRFFAFSPTEADAAKVSGASLTLTDANHAGTPQLTYTVPSDVSRQIDLLAACSDVNSSSVPLGFRHALTAIHVKTGQDMWPGTITQVRISGVYGSGTYTFGPDVTDSDGKPVGTGGTWTPAGQPDVSYTVKRDIKLPAADDLSHTTPGSEIIGKKDNLSFILIPQTLGADAEMEITFVDELSGGEHIFRASLSGKTWEPGKIVTYSLSQKSIKIVTKVTIDRTATDTIPFSGYMRGATVRVYSEVTQTGKDAVSCANLPFKIECAEVGSEDWEAVDSVRVAAGTKDANGVRPSTYNLCLPAQPEFAAMSAKFTPSENGKGTADAPYLLTKDTGGETANCYVINDYGYYSLPLVYGNALGPGGAVNEKAYKPLATYDAVTEDNNLPQFVDHDNKPITSAYIYNRYTPADAVLIWQDAPDMVTDVKLAADGHHLQFHIDRHSLTQGNAVVAVRDASGTILWSWQIWATYHDLSKNTGCHPITAKVSNNTYYLAPVNLGYCDRHKGNDERKFKLRIIPDLSGVDKTLTAEPIPVPVEFVQEKYIESEAGDNTYYQWGRKDAMPGGIYNKDVPDIWPADQGRCDMQNKRFFNGAYNFGVDEGRATLGKSIQTPYIQYSSPNRIIRKNNAPYPNNYYDNRIFWLWDHRDNNGIPQPFSATLTKHPLLYNLWNGLRTEPFNDEVVPGSSATDEQKAAWTAAETTFSKTIYDPCPTGFHVPNNHILSHFFKEGTGGGPDSATWDNYVSVMIDDEGGGETIGEKFKDSAGNPIIFYFVGLRDHRYPPNERPSTFPDDYTVPAHRHIIALGTTCSQPASTQNINFGSGDVVCHRSNRPTPIWFDIRPTKTKKFVMTIGSNASYGFSIRPVHD